MTRHDVIVAGGGFAGIYAAWRLARAGASVALIEASAEIGGNLQSRPWEGYWLDNGTHNLDLGSPLGRAFYTDVLGEELRVLDDPCWASTVGESWTAGFERPDFAADDPALAARALAELEGLRAAATGAVPLAASEGYLEWYREIHGATLAEAIGPMVRKVSGGDPSTLSADARDSLGMFSRPKLGDDERMLALKASDPFWDARLGVTLGCGDPRFTGVDVRGRIGYPARRGLRGFCERAARRLAELGVETFTGCAIDRVEDTAQGVTLGAGERRWSGGAMLWTLPDFLLAGLLGIAERTRELSMPVGHCFFAFEVEERAIAGPDFLSDYSPNRLPFRYNHAGVYGAQRGDGGHTPVMAEVPCHPADIGATLTPDNAAAAWAALLDTGFLRADARCRRSTAWGHPVAYSLPRRGWGEAQEALRRTLTERLPHTVGIVAGCRGRDAFMRHYDTTLQHVLTGADTACGPADTVAARRRA